MDMGFDIFTRLPDGRPVWIDAFDSLDDAKIRLDVLSLFSPGEYFIYSRKDGSTIANSRSEKSRVPESAQNSFQGGRKEHHAHV